MANYFTGQGNQAQANRGTGQQAGNTPSSNQQMMQLALSLANDIVAEQQAAAQLSKLGRVYTPFVTNDDILPLQVETVTKGLFTGNTGSFTTMFTSSLLTATQRSYFHEVHSIGDPATVGTARSELAIAYGHFDGSGSKDTTGNLNNDTPSRAIYKQYAQLLLAPNDKKFTINGTDTNAIYILNFNRANIREKIDPGNFEISLAQLSGSTGADGNDGQGPDLNSSHTGSSVTLGGAGYYVQVIDDSTINDPTQDEAGQVYNLVSGSLDGGVTILNPSSPTYFGLLYPQHGIAILNADQLDKRSTEGGVNFNSVTGSQIEGENALKLFKSISSSNDLTGVAENGGIQARSSEQVKSTYYFVRIKNGEYNYSNNPSFTSGSLGDYAFTTFKSNPQVYITTVGLYNLRKELLAVAKLSQPLLKNFTREALVKVKLDF
tara:strand:- start:613 stop:1914 length:1302 start_codon:yes stop_codon:yes gene_type:complete